MNQRTVDLSGPGLLLVIALAGFFGGLVDGLRSDRQYKARFGNYSKEMGSVGDGLVGSAAALAIFAFAENVFGSATPPTLPMPVLTFIKIVAWGVLSGYAGTRLLDPLSSKVVKQIAGDTARAEVRDRLAKDDAAQESLREAAQLVAQHLERLARMGKGDTYDEVERLLKGAERKYDLVLKGDPSNAAAQIGLANVHCYRGEYMHRAHDDKSDDSFARAIKVVDGLIKRDANMAKAYYNRACYKALRAQFAKKKAEPDAVDDLLRAVELDEHLKEYAVDDDDLTLLRGEEKLPFLTKKPATK